MKILIIGGYGVFGGRLAELLSDIDTLEILVGGRSFERGQAFCAAYSFETVRGDRFCFDVEIAAPLIGLIVAYDGVLEPD